MWNSGQVMLKYKGKAVAIKEECTFILHALPHYFWLTTEKGQACYGEAKAEEGLLSQDGVSTKDFWEKCEEYDQSGL